MRTCQLPNVEGRFVVSSGVINSWPHRLRKDVEKPVDCIHSFCNLSVGTMWMYQCYDEIVNSSNGVFIPRCSCATTTSLNAIPSVGRGKLKRQCCSSAIKTRGLPSYQHLDLSGWSPNRNWEWLQWKWPRCNLCVGQHHHGDVKSPPVIALTWLSGAITSTRSYSRQTNAFSVNSRQHTCRNQYKRNMQKSSKHCTKTAAMKWPAEFSKVASILAVIPATSSSVESAPMATKSLRTIGST